jgi:hypothetical protein
MGESGECGERGGELRMKNDKRGKQLKAVKPVNAEVGSIKN